MTHVTCRLTAKNWDQLWNPMLGIWVWATCTFLLAKVFLNFWKHKTSLHILSSVSLSSAVKHKLSDEICIFKQDSARRTGGIEHPVMFLMNFGKMFTNFKHSSTGRSNDKFAVETLVLHEVLYQHLWGEVGYLVMNLLQIYHWSWQWKNFENRLALL